MWHIALGPSRTPLVFATAAVPQTQCGELAAGVVFPGPSVVGAGVSFGLRAFIGLSAALLDREHKFLVVKYLHAIKLFRFSTTVLS